MVSKGKILGKYSLIFVTAGSTDFQFERLFSCLDNVLFTLNKNFLLVAQIGSSKYKWKYKIIDINYYLSPKKIIYFFKKADKILSHGGPVSIYQAVKYAKNMPLIVPRLAKFNEHVDNHQLFFTKFLRAQLPENLQKYFIIDGDIKLCLNNYLKEKPVKNILNQYIFKKSDKKNILKKLNQFILDSKS